MLQQVVYASVAVGPQSDSVLGEILETARRNNRRDELTGMLLTADQCYFQVLEGPRGNIDSLLERLKWDQRHKGMQITSRTAIDARSFPDWSMGCEKIVALAEKDGAFNIRDIAERIDIEILTRHTPVLVMLMRAFFLSSRREMTKPSNARMARAS